MVCRHKQITFVLHYTSFHPAILKVVTNEK
jgi:hypothetical protein